jgi:hypothetical protein
MRKKQLFISIMLVSLSATVPPAVEAGVPGEKAQPFVGQDLHLVGKKLISFQLSAHEHVLVFQDGFSMSIGANQFSSDTACVWLESISTEFRGRIRVDVKGRAYLQGNISVKKATGAKTTGLTQMVIEEGQAMVVRFTVTGEVFVTADKREIADPRGLELYKKALAAVEPIKPEFVVAPEALVPELPPERIPPEEAVPKKPGLIERIFAPEKPAKPEKKPRFRYPVNWAPAGEVTPKVERTKAPDGTDVATIIGRLYVWQKLDEEGGLLELQADNAVIFYSGGQLAPLDTNNVGGKSANGGKHLTGLAESQEQTSPEDILASGAVKAIYMSGDVVMTEGQRTIRADEVYYDFQRKKALAVNAVMRSFDVRRRIPIYVRAGKLRQLAENKFAAEDITLTSSEFYLPQISVNASSVIITDTTSVDQQAGVVSDSSYDAQMRDVRLKMGEKTIFYWPFMRSNLQRPDIPLKSVHTGYDDTWGASIETRWYLSRLLGLPQPEGTDSTFELDYYSKRGLGSAVEFEYEREKYFGRLSGFLIHDRGKDDLGRADFREDLEPPRKLRGRFRFQHRHFLPSNWQLTTGIDYQSDERLLESYYRNEFNVGEPPETYIHLKRLQDNWALAFLAKGRINDFADQLEELPTAEFHLTGQSLFDDRFTLYSDTQISRLRQRIGNDHLGMMMDENHFAFASHRTELDMPFGVKAFKIVPFVAGTFGYDDRSGFTRTLVNGTGTGSFGEDEVWLGEAGIRVGTQYWKVYPDVNSRLWDLNQLRHIIKPRLTAVCYAESDSVVAQHDVFNIGISQRLQTKRGAGDKQRTVDWMRLDTDFTAVRDSESAGTTGPDKFIWNRPMVPLRVLSAPDIFHGDLENDGIDRGLRRFEMYGPRRNYFSTDYIWRLSDSTAILSDYYYDIQRGTIEQFNFGFSHFRWPNLSYYIGTRYLRQVEVLDEKGSNTLTFAATYVLDPRYTVVFSQQFDFDYGRNCRSDITLIRRYHRMYWGLTFSADQSLDRQAIVFSIWPQGVPELAIGRRRYMELGGSAGY